MEKEKIQFKPLHDGMGFHPFSDGLPYAPESKKATSPRVSSTGSGATAAGRPHFATARQLKEMQQKAAPSPDRSLDPLVGRSTSTPKVDYPKVISTQLKTGRSLERPITGAVPSSQTAPTATPIAAHAEPGLLRRRAFAYLMDTIIHAGFWLGTNLTALLFFHFQLDAAIVEEHLSQFVVFFLISQWLFIAFQEMLFETTIGKAFFNLEFKRIHSSLFFRSVVFMVGLLSFGLGLYFRPQDRFGQLQLKSKIYS
jgi:hypothetical protein